MLVEEDHVGKTGGLRRLNKVAENQVSSVEANRSWKKQSDLLCKGRKAGRWVSRGGNQDARVDNTRELCIFVVKIELLIRSQVIARLIVLVVLAEFLVVCNLWCKRLASGERCSQLGALL